MDPTLPTFPHPHAHTWLQTLRVAYIPGQTTPLLEEAAQGLIESFRKQGHTIYAQPKKDTQLIFTTAIFGEPLKWRQALLFTARRRYKLDHNPVLFTLVHITPKQFQEILAHFAIVLGKDELDSADYAFPGLASRAFYTLHEQGLRGGPILSLVRLVQSQSLSIRVILFVGNEHPQEAYTMDLVGAHPCTQAANQDSFYTDLALRMVTAASTQEVTQHQVVGDIISQERWRSLSTPLAMRRAGLEFGERRFFTEMVQVENLVDVPAVPDAVSRQYSEGCFATWDPHLDALVTTITGSARPVEKDNLSDNELAIITGLRPDRLGALIHHVAGKRNDPPSSEAVEMLEVDSQLPRITLGEEWGLAARVPVLRSKLHGHRGIRSYDPQVAEHVFLDEAYYLFPVSCSTEAQARAITTAFARAQSLQNPADPRQLAFTVLPGHGIVIAEKWVPGKVPFQVIWEAMDSGALEIDNRIPQGPLAFTPNEEGKAELTGSF